MDALNVVYLKKAAVIQRVEKSDDGFSELPDNLRLTVRDYLAGEKFRGSRAKFYRHRRDFIVGICFPTVLIFSFHRKLLPLFLALRS